ncbi:HET-domain-containing protein [Ganoderma leucocontextum]|nr:HET-domain-containing protein [Ganoderma leucocontextum]
MRLLNTKTAVLHQFNNPTDIPPYAILSHVWQKEEQSLQDISDPAKRDAAHPWAHISQKIRDCCTFAAREGFKWIWIDTCCIDKTSSSELSEAINSMYAWYAAADVCYVWLHDVDDTHPSQSGPSSFSQTTWFTRGWTLQELLAPRYVVFLSRKWHTVGTKQTLAHRISRITGIDDDVLLQIVDLHEVGVARRMSWAATRRTTREEDRAYSLMGIFDVNMSTIYGEGSKAFLRLQIEILKQCPDQTIFAWGRPSIDCHALIANFSSVMVTKELRDSTVRSLLASSPADFEHSGNISPISLDSLSELLGQFDLAPPEYSTTAYGMRTAFPIVDIPSLGRDPGISIAILACQDSEGNLVVLFLNQRRILWISAAEYLVYRVGADLYPNSFPFQPPQYYRLGRIHLSSRDDSSFLKNIAVHPVFIEYNPFSVRSSLPKPPSHSRRSTRVSYAFFFPAWLLESAGITATLDDHQTIEHEDGITVEFTPGGPTQRTIIFARDPPPSPPPRYGNGGPQGIRLSMSSHCSCGVSPLRHPMSISIDLMVPEHNTRPDGHASFGRHRRRRSLSAILKNDHRFVQMMLNAPASPSPCEHVQLPIRPGHAPIPERSPALEGEVEQAWQCANKRTHIPTISNPSILLSFNSVLGSVSVGLKRWDGCRKSNAAYVYIVELKITSSYQVPDPERQASLPTYTHGVVPETGVIVYPTEESSGHQTRENVLGLAQYADDDDHSPLAVVEGEQPFEDGTGESAVLSPLSPTWSSSSFDGEIPSHSPHIRRYLSPNLEPGFSPWINVIPGIPYT